MAAEVDVDATAAVEKRPSEKELFRAAETGDDSAFASLTPADLSLRNEDGRSLIHVAAAAGHPQVVLALMKAGGDDAVAGVLNAKDLDGLAPIHSVASTGDAQMMDILLKRGAKVNLISDRGRTALHYAATARSGKIDIAEKLKAHHADVKIQDKGLHQEKEKLRHLFVPEDEERNHLILKDLLVGQETTKIWTIPGSEWKMTHNVSETRLVKLVEKESSSVILSTEVARGASQKLVQLVWTLNSYGWSFLGDLSAEHILMTPTGDVRLKMIV